MTDRLQQVKACLNGGRSKAEHPAVPVTPAELAAEAAAAVKAGAEALHIHPRGSGTAESVLPHDVAAAVDAVRGWLRILVEIIGVAAADAAAQADRIMRQLATSGVSVPWLLHGEGQTCWPTIRHAGRLGLATRIGLEDTLAGPDGEPVSGNAELISLAPAIWGDAAAPR